MFGWRRESDIDCAGHQQLCWKIQKRWKHSGAKVSHTSASEETACLDVEKWEALTGTAWVSSVDGLSASVACSGSAHSLARTAHSVRPSFPHLPVTIETQRRRLQKAGWQTDTQETWVES